MTDYTICSKVLEAATHNKRYLTDLLNNFACTISWNSVVKNKKILDIYMEINDESIRSWINIMSYTENNSCWKDIWEVEGPIFIKACNKTHDKKLIVSEKEDYDNYEWLSPINKDEAIINLNWIQNTTIINQNWDNSQATGGSNSPIW